MLFLLTGDVQIGKTRWLDHLVGELAKADVECFGVVAPGVWVESEGEHANAQGFEKLGIDNRLLPSGKLIRFAERIDLAKANGTFDGESEAGKVELGWHISDKALAEVNAYLSTIPELCREGDYHAGLLVIDELGRLELNHEGGLTEAVKLMEAGPQGIIKHALLVVRETLADKAIQRFAGAWGGMKVIDPTSEAETEIKHVLL